MRTLGWTAACAAAICIGFAAEARPSSLTGGPFDGLRAEVSDETGQPIYFLPGLARQNPPSAARLSKITPALEQATRDYPGCRAEEPFELYGGTRVRVGLACGDRLTKFIMFGFSGDELVSTQVTDAVVPRVAVSRAAPPVGD
jgi:hypothetical protein